MGFQLPTSTGFLAGFLVAINCTSLIIDPCDLLPNASDLCGDLSVLRPCAFRPSGPEIPWDQVGSDPLLFGMVLPAYMGISINHNYKDPY